MFSYRITSTLLYAVINVSILANFGWFLNHGKVTEFRDGNGKSPKNRLIYKLVIEIK